MTVLRHIIFAACYVAVAVAVALALPLAGVGVDRSYGLLLGLVVFVFGGLLHEFYARMEQAERLEDRLDRLLDRQRDVLAALDRLVRPSAEAGGAVAAVVSDARMLRTLADQMPAGGPSRRKRRCPSVRRQAWRTLRRPRARPRRPP
ncbi:hypothetical protein UCD39_19060 [Nitrospirillum sp. BR 11752]|uniref:hypothetical protein n=1 Tax=Nitrospirillum sp. BR 11752 TaxID=3104293 RepID=UPI002E9D1F75|nr:hypothetical protein [Nitrospirillum sp. BR 11752]